MQVFCKIMLAAVIFFTLAGSSHANDASYLVSIGNSEDDTGREVTGYKCKDDEICRIKVMPSPHAVVLARLQFYNHGTFIFFKNDNDNLYVSMDRHFSDKKYLRMVFEDRGCTKQAVSLFRCQPGFDDGILREHPNCQVADLLIDICPTK